MSVAKITIPQANPYASYLAQQAEIRDAVAQVLESGRYILGDQVRAFEAEFAAWNGLQEVIGVGSGTDALTLALKALGIGRGHEVITTAHTASATIAAIELTGAAPKLVDIDPLTFSLDCRQVPGAVTQNTRALLPVHLFGLPAELDTLLAVARRHDLFLVEDCAQAHGALYRGQRVGTFGDASAFSFYPTKNLGALGDGGAVGTMDSGIARRVRQLAQYGWNQRYVSDAPGMNSRLDELQAAILRVKLCALARDNERRREIARRYDAALRTVVAAPAVPADCQSAYHLYVVRHPQRDRLREFLAQRGIGTAVHYPVPIHLQPAYRGRLGDVGSFPEAERAAREIVSLPMYPELTDPEVDQVIDALLAFRS